MVLFASSSGTEGRLECLTTRLNALLLRGGLLGSKDGNGLFELSFLLCRLGPLLPVPGRQGMVSFPLWRIPDMRAMPLSKGRFPDLGVVLSFHLFPCNTDDHLLAKRERTEIQTGLSPLIIQSSCFPWPSESSQPLILKVGVFPLVWLDTLKPGFSMPLDAS